MIKLPASYFQKDCLFLAQNLIGKTLARRFEDGTILRRKIIETEAYIGEEDKASHARMGKTNRNQIMYEAGGTVYMYLIYGAHWMLNIVSGKEGNPEAILVRGVEGCSGPGRVGKLYGLNRDFYGEDLTSSPRLWIEDSHLEGSISSTPRIGIDYAESPWKEMPWRFIWKGEEGETAK